MNNYESKIVELNADIHTIWKLQCQNLYNSKNLGALAVREMLQNSIDSILQALKENKITHGKIDINFSKETGEMSVEDNGMGMDIETIHTKFLTLGGTTKDNEENTGGFGLAKSVILGCGSGFKVETQDNIFTSEFLGKLPVQKQEYLHGTRITIYNVQVGNNKTLSEDYSNMLESAVLDYVESSRIPKNISIYINGNITKCEFVPKVSTHRIPAMFNIATSNIPRDTELQIDVYKNDSSIHYLYVQLRGLTQFKTYIGWNANCDVVLNFNTTINPRDVDYPFSTNRESLKNSYQGIIEAIKDKISQSPMSISDNSRYKEILYDNVDNGTTQQYDNAVALAHITTSSEVSNTAISITKILGMESQGDYKVSTISDYISQYNSSIDSLSKEHNVSKNSIIQELAPQSIFQLNNPLSFSWIICKSKTDTLPTLRQSKAVSYVLKWDAILKLMCAVGLNNYNKPFYPGLILEKDTLGLCMEKHLIINNEDKYRKYVMFNPFECTYTDPLQQTIWIMGVAAHELAHWYCDTFEAHGETWAQTREAILNRNLHNIDKIMKIFTQKSLPSNKKKSTLSYRNKSIEDLEILARTNYINVDELKARYTNPSIYRMRLVMQLKSIEE